MTNVPNIQGPLSRPDPSQDKPSNVDEHKFKETLHQRVGKTDADQKKQRRQQEEEPEVTPQSSQEPTTTTPEGQDSFLGVQGGTKQSFKSSTPSSLSQSPSTIYSNAPSSSSEEDESAPSYNDATSSQQSTSSQTSSTQQTTPSHKSEQEHKEKPAEPAALAVPLPPLEKPLVAPMAPTALAMEKQIIVPLEIPLAEEIPVTAPLSGFIKPLQVMDTEKKKEITPLFDATADESILISGNMPILLAPQALGSEDPFSRMPPAIQEIFTKMLGVMTIWKETSGVTETSFTLSNPKFAASVFFGTQIIIKEFSTAPLAFNVQLNGSQQATALLQSNLGDLMAAFQAGRYNFKINRLETGMLVERPLFHRKESPSEQHGQQT